MYVKVSNYVLWNLGMFCGEHYPSFWLNNNLCLLWWVGEKCQSVFIFALLDTKWMQIFCPKKEKIILKIFGWEKRPLTPISLEISILEKNYRK